MRDGARSLPALLDALEAQTLDRGRFEVIVVDDGSRDGSGDVARASAGVTVLSTGAPSGSYAARNVALQRARGGVLAFTDADCLPERGWLAAMLESLERLGADLVGGRIAAPLPAHPGLPALVDVARHWDQRAFVDREGFAATANLSCRREVLKRIGGFDGRLRSGGDREFCFRATAAGFRLAYSPDAVVTHPPRERAGSLVRKTYRHGAGWAQTGMSLRGLAPLLAVRSARFGESMLRAAGASPTAVRSLEIDAAGYALAAAPALAGYLVERARRRRPAPA